MLINKALKLCMFFIFIGTAFACSFKNKEENYTESEAKIVESEILSLADRKTIDEYNQIITTYIMDDENKFHEKLKLFTPKALQIQNKNEKNNILMNIYMQTKQYNNAYKLNELLINKKETANRVAFRCQLLELLDKDKSTKKECYEISAKLMKENLNKIQKNDPMYSYSEFLYFLEMYKAGHKEYREKMETALSLIKDQSLKMNANIWYEDAIFN